MSQQVLSPRSSAKQRSDFDMMLQDVRSKLEEKLKQFKEKQTEQKITPKELQDLQTLSTTYRKLIESKDFDLKDLEQINNAEKELKAANNDQQRVLLELQELRQKLAQLQSEQRVVEQDIQIEEMRKQILEKLKNLKEQIIRQKQTLSDQGQQKATKDLTEQIQQLQRYLSAIENLEKTTMTNLKQDLSRKIKECDDEYLKTKQDLISANQSKQTLIKRLQDQIGNQQKQNELLNQEKDQNALKIAELQGQLSQLVLQKNELIANKEKELQQLYQESNQVEIERQKLEERHVELTHELQLTQRELRQTQMVSNYLYQEKQSVENFNKANPQINMLRQILEQAKNKAQQIGQESSMLKEDWERKKMRLEQDQIQEVNLMNQKMIQKLGNEVDKLIKEKEGELQKLKIKCGSLEQSRQKQEQLVDQDQIERLKGEYIQKHNAYRQAYLEKAQIYGIIGDQTKDIVENNSEFVDKEINHSKKQLEKEIFRVTVENNEDQLRIIEDKLYKAKDIEESYLSQFGLYDKQINELSLKLQDREDDINQLEEILEDKDKYIDDLRKEVEAQQAARKKMQVVVPKQKATDLNKGGYQFPLKRLNQSEFLFAGKVINAKVSNGKLLFRTGGGYIMFDEFLLQYAKPQVEELRQFALGENLTLEEVLRKFEQHYIEEYYQGQNQGISSKIGNMYSQQLQTSQKKSSGDVRSSIKSPTRGDQGYS